MEGLELGLGFLQNHFALDQGSGRSGVRTSGVMVICALVRRDTGLREPVCLARRWLQRTECDISEFSLALQQAVHKPDVIKQSFL